MLPSSGAFLFLLLFFEPFFSLARRISQLDLNLRKKKPSGPQVFARLDRCSHLKLIARHGSSQPVTPTNLPPLPCLLSCLGRHHITTTTTTPFRAISEEPNQNQPRSTVLVLYQIALSLQENNPPQNLQHRFCLRRRRDKHKKKKKPTRRIKYERRSPILTRRRKRRKQGKQSEKATLCQRNCLLWQLFPSRFSL